MGRKKKSEQAAATLYEEMKPLMEEFHALKEWFEEYKAQEKEEEERRQKERVAQMEKHGRRNVKTNI